MLLYNASFLHSMGLLAKERVSLFPTAPAPLSLQLQETAVSLILQMAPMCNPLNPSKLTLPVQKKGGGVICGPLGCLSSHPAGSDAAKLASALASAGLPAAPAASAQGRPAAPSDSPSGSCGADAGIDAAVSDRFPATRTSPTTPSSDRTVARTPSGHLCRRSTARLPHRRLRKGWTRSTRVAGPSRREKHFPGPQATSGVAL